MRGGFCFFFLFPLCKFIYFSYLVLTFYNFEPICSHGYFIPMMPVPRVFARNHSLFKMFIYTAITFQMCNRYVVSPPHQNIAHYPIVTHHIASHSTVSSTIITSWTAFSLAENDLWSTFWEVLVVNCCYVRKCCKSVLEVFWWFPNIILFITPVIFIRFA